MSEKFVPHFDEIEEAGLHLEAGIDRVKGKFEKKVGYQMKKEAEELTGSEIKVKTPGMEKQEQVEKQMKEELDRFISEIENPKKK